MSFNDDYQRLRKRRLEGKEQDYDLPINQSPRVYLDTLLPDAYAHQDDIAPVRLTPQEQQMGSADERKWFQKGAFEDGWQPFDLTKTIYGSIVDLKENVGAGILGMGEKIVDAGAYIVGGVGGLFSKDFKDDVGDFIAKDLYDEEEVAKKILSSPTQMLLGIDSEANSVFGEKSDALAQSGGQLLATAGLNAVGVPWYLTTGITTFGSEVENAFNKGATYGQAGLSAAITAGAEILTEKISGGISFGGKTLDDGLTNLIASNISKKTAQALLKFGVDAAGEGFEEVFSNAISAVGQKITYDKDKNISFGEMFLSEEAFENFIGGMALGGFANVGKVGNSIKTGRDYRTGLTDNEQKVFDNVYNKRVAEAQEGGKELSKKEKDALYDAVMRDLEKGRIDTDTIEGIFGGETYKSYQSIIEQESPLREEIDNINNNKSLTDEQKATLVKSVEEKLQTLAKDTNKAQIRAQLDAEMKNLLVRKTGKDGKNLQADNYLIESYNERARKVQPFQATTTVKYKSEAAKTTAKNAVESGVLNNNSYAHDLVDMMVHISEDTGVVVGFTNDEKMVAEGRAIEGDIPEGYTTDDGFVINVNAPRYLNVLTGHELTNKFEKNGSYGNFATVIEKYARDKGEWDSRYAKRYERYKKAYGFDDTADSKVKKEYEDKIKKEVVADLVGDYLFADENFVRHLSSDHRNIFQKMYDEIKYLWKLATAGSKEARELEKVKRAFDKAYKESGKASEGMKYFISEDGNLGYHAGDLGKAESLGSQSYDRGTGHFGRGTYFVGNKELVKDYNKRDGKQAPQHAVDFTDYNLYKVKSDKDGYALHEQLKVIDGGINERWIAAASRDDFSLASITEWADIAKQRYAEDKVYSNEGQIYGLTELAKREGIEIPSKEQFAEQEGYDLSDEWLEGDYAEHLKDIVKSEIESINEGYAKFRDAYFDLNLRFGFGDKVLNAMKQVLEYQNANNKGGMDAYKKDTLATVFMKSLGYEGVDTRGTALDNVAYGSVIYDLKDNTVRYSLSDSDGKQLTKEQQEYFKDSKVRDKDGNLKVMYHGTPNGDFSIFKDGTYFTEHKWYADRYQNPGASSISTGKVASNPKTFEVYLDIKKPFDINDAEARSIYINDYIKGGNAVGINPYLSDAEYSKIDAIDWTEGEDLREFLIDNGYDYDGLVLDEGAVGGYGEDVIYRGKSYVVFSPEQVKNVDNRKPTRDPDIRFSLSKSVEESGGLVAIHNMQSSELSKAIALGGMPMPSIAIIKAQQSHEAYGDVSIIFPKDSIDPETNRDNKIYGGDAWTPTYPSIEYKASEKAQKAIQTKINGLVPYDVQKALGNLSLDYDNISSDLNRHNGDMYQAYRNNRAMQYAFLVDNGFSNKLPMTEKDLDGSGRFDNSLIVDVVEKLGASKVERFANGRIDDALIAELMNLANENAKAKYVGNSELLQALRNRPLYTDKNFGFSQADSIIRAAYRYVQNGLEQTVDYRKAGDVIEQAVDKDAYKEWLDNLFSDIVEKEGIRNNADYFTPSGNRRSWEALHWENTLENVLKVMKAQNQKGEGFFGGASIFGAATKNYDSIDEVRADSERLRTMPEDEYDALKESFSNRLVEIANSIKDPNERNGFIALDNAVEEIVDAVRTSKNKSSILRNMQKWNKRVTAEIVDDIVSLVTDISNMPTGYFEAKPRRAVGFDEVGVFVIPRNADVKLKQELLNRGYAIAEYDPDVEGDRQKVVNSFEEYKFSLSNVGEPQKRYGNYNIYGKDVRYEAPMQEQVAPTQETVSKMETVAPDFAPITEDEANALQSENVDSLTDADAPPEMEAPYYGETQDAAPIDPFEDRNMKEVSRDRKTPAYMYENPEVKPFFQAEANILLGELERVEKPETIYNGWAKYEMSYEFAQDIPEVYRTERIASDTIVYLRDTIGMSYADIEKGLKAIIEDNGAENIAAAKKLEFVINDRLLYGYQDFYGYDIPANQDYINLLTEKEIREYSEEARKQFFDVADAYAPQEDDIAPVAATTEETSEVPVKEKYEAIRPKRETTTEPRLKRVTDGETYDTAKKGQIDGQQALFKESTTPTKEQPIKTVKDRLTHKLHASYGELSHNKRLRREAIESFNRKIDALQFEYDNKKNKDTKVANDILRRIERYTRLRDDVDADYTKRINDLRAKVDKYKTKVDEGFDDTEGRAMRSELHAQKVDEIKAEFSKNGYDFDAVLKNAKNLPTLATVDNTPQRVMEKALGYKEGQILADETVNKVAQNETEGIKWLNAITSRKDGLLKQLSDKYHIKPGSKESAAAQMYAEGFYANDNGDLITYGDAELAKDFPDAQTQNNIKGLAADSRIRQFYDETLAQINESRTRNAYPEIQPLDNYYLHFRAMDDTFSRLGIPFNPNDIRAKDLPTDLNGVTADLKPGQPYFASAMHRRGNKTSYDLLGGIERYATGAKNQIYHIDDIQTLRALRNYIADTYGQGKGLEGLDSLTEEEVQERIEKVYGSHLSTFAKFLNEEANVIAGKTALIDRGLEGVIGRRGITFLDTVNKQVGSNMVGFNVSSSLTNVIPVMQAFAKTNKLAFVKGFAQTVSNRLGSISGNSDGFAESSPVMIRRKGADRFYRTPFQKVGDAGYTLMGAVDSISTEIIARAKYNELTQKGMDAEQAHIETDKWVSRLMGDRSLGQTPQLYNSKMLGLVTKFQLEVRNQLDSQFYDTIQEAKVSTEDIENQQARNAKTAAKVASTFFQLAVAQHVFGKAFEAVAGYNPAFDIISVLATLFGFDDDEESEDTALDNIEQGFLELLEDLPYTSVLTGGRIPISSALPITELIKGEDEYGNEKSRLETLGEVAPYYILPTGYGQIKKTAQGLSMFSDEHPVSGSYTDSGNLRFPVEETFGNVAQAAIFGQWANKNARAYFDNDIAPLNPKQTQEYIDVDMPIKDYWDYRKGLKGLSTLEEKAEYINGLDLTDEQKNILINNIANRKDDLDMSDYDDYENFDEFDYASKYPDKYAFLKDNGISYATYNASKESREAYNWAYNNPEKYTLSKAISSDVVAYRRYTADLYDIKADKDENGKSITGSRKEKVAEYINNLDADYGEKIILFKSEYPADDSYNAAIVQYLNNRNDISYDEMVAILKELGFTVKGNTVTWD